MSDPFNFRSGHGGDLSDLEPRLTPVPRESRARKRNMARTILWSVYVISAIVIWMLQTATTALGGDGPRIGFREIHILLSGFFLFYAIDRIIG